MNRKHATRNSEKASGRAVFSPPDRSRVVFVEGLGQVRLSGKEIIVLRYVELGDNTVESLQRSLNARWVTRVLLGLLGKRLLKREVYQSIAIPSKRIAKFELTKYGEDALMALYPGFYSYWGIGRPVNPCLEGGL
ncbi:MAG: hypothetical protein QXI37_02065 [Thermoprotei archaeon]